MSAHRNYYTIAQVNPDTVHCKCSTATRGRVQGIHRREYGDYPISIRAASECRAVHRELRAWGILFGDMATDTFNDKKIVFRSKKFNEVRRVVIKIIRDQFHVDDSKCSDDDAYDSVDEDATTAVLNPTRAHSILESPVPSPPCRKRRINEVHAIRTYRTFEGGEWRAYNAWADELLPPEMVIADYTRRGYGVRSIYMRDGDTWIQWHDSEDINLSYAQIMDLPIGEPDDKHTS